MKTYLLTRLKFLTVVILIVLASLVDPNPTAAKDTPYWGGICTEHIYTTRFGWICLESLPKATQENYLASKNNPSAAQTKDRSLPDPQAEDRPLPASQPDESLADLPYHYLQVFDARVPLYTTLDAAVSRGKPARHLIPGFDYVAFHTQVNVKGKWYYKTSSGFWMPGRDAAYLGHISPFQGLEFNKTPTTDFGWVLYDMESQRAPGVGDPGTAGSQYQRYDVVRILEEGESEGGTQYLRVGEGEWLPARSVARVSLQDAPPEKVKGASWIDINLAQQTLAVYENGELAFATLISSGIGGNWTRPGTFRIKSKKETELMRGSFAPDRSDYYYLENVPWTMYFDEARALHGTYWHDSFGTQQSKGCVNLSPGDAHWLFNWAEEGDWVHVYDPTGETPTDPDQYHAGGA